MQIIYNFEISNVYALRSEIRKFSFQNDEKKKKKQSQRKILPVKKKSTTIHL